MDFSAAAKGIVDDEEFWIKVGLDNSCCFDVSTFKAIKYKESRKMAMRTLSRKHALPFGVNKL